MNSFEKFLWLLQAKMERPKAFEWFHLLCLSLALLIIVLICKKKFYKEHNLKIVLGAYGVVAFILELLKQLIWTFNYDGVVTYDYQWYSFPFQLCTTPIFVSLICLFLKKGRLRDSLLSYMAFITILGSISTALLPVSCFVEDILVNIHTMYLHLGSLVVSMYLIASKEVEISKKNIISALVVFYIFVGIALLLNICVYNSGILNGEEFNMFYISPYFISNLPVFNILQEKLPYIIYLIFYIITLSCGGILVYFISKLIKNRK